jgi:hypothetical protein
MTATIDETSQRRAARIAGFLYPIVIIAGIFSEFFVRSSLIVPRDAAVTVKHILTSEWLFRISHVSDLIAHTCYFLLALALYVLLKPVNKNLALLFVFIVAISVAILCINMLNHFAALLLLSGAGYLKVFEAEQLHALALFFLNLHTYGYLIAQIFYGGWLLPLGYLVFKSGYFPRILGILLVIASFSYLIDFLTQIFFPDYVAIISPIVVMPAAIAEILFALWLLLKGVNIQQKDNLKQ